MSQVPLWALHRAWIRVTCRCGRTVALPVTAAADRWPDLVLGRLVERLRCRSCGASPAHVAFASRADAFGGALVERRRIWLLR